MAMSGAERMRAMRQRRGAIPRGELKPHGTVAAARRHQRAGESLRHADTVCQACTEAWAKYQSEYQKNYRLKHPSENPRKETQPHGTMAAARRHQRAGESINQEDTVCQECTDGLAEYRRNYRQKEGSTHG